MALLRIYRIIRTIRPHTGSKNSRGSKEVENNGLHDGENSKAFFEQCRITMRILRYLRTCLYYRDRIMVQVPELTPP
jgi:hypothetical protein